MKPEAQRMAIAEACGIRATACTVIHGCEVWYYHGLGGVLRTVPDYLNDLNAMHEAEKGLGPLQQSNYSKFVADAVGIDDNSDTIYWEYYALIHATAAQRAEAFLRTIGRWGAAP